VRKFVVPRRTPATCLEACGEAMLERSLQIDEKIDNLRRVFQVVHGQLKKAERETGLTSLQLWTEEQVKKLVGRKNKGTL